MLRGVRGATTAMANEPEAVRTATKNLLVALTKANALKPGDIAAVIFSSTPDLNAAFPASAARELGWNEVPLCIRVLILLNTDKSQHEIQPIYQAGAVVLRPDISVDGRR